MCNSTSTLVHAKASAISSGTTLSAPAYWPTAKGWQSACVGGLPRSGPRPRTTRFPDGGGAREGRPRRPRSQPHDQTSPIRTGRSKPRSELPQLLRGAGTGSNGEANSCPGVATGLKYPLSADSDGSSAGWSASNQSDDFAWQGLPGSVNRTRERLIRRRPRRLWPLEQSSNIAP